MSKNKKKESAYGDGYYENLSVGCASSLTAATCDTTAGLCIDSIASASLSANALTLTNTYNKAYTIDTADLITTTDNTALNGLSYEPWQPLTVSTPLICNQLGTGIFDSGKYYVGVDLSGTVYVDEFKLRSNRKRVTLKFSL